MDKTQSKLLHKWRHGTFKRKGITGPRGSIESCRNIDEHRKLHDEIREDLAIRERMIASDAESCLTDLNRWFQENPTQNSTENLKRILNDINLAKENAMVHARQIGLQLETIAKTLDKTHGDGFVEPNCPAELQRQLEEIKKTVGIYEMMQEIDLSADAPYYTLSFGALSPILVPAIPQYSSESHSSAVDTTAMVIAPADSLPRATELKQNTEDTTTLSTGSPDFIWKTNKINKFATDGLHIFYTSYSKAGPDLIAYCHLHNRDETALSCNWNQSRILDIAWWDCIGGFVCATNDGIYAVTIQEDAFGIEHKLKGTWSQVRISTNSRLLWLWTKSDTFHGVLVYGSDFALDQTIDVTNSQIKHFVRDSSSFCLTEKFVASIYKQTEKNCQRLQVHFSNFNLINFKTVRLGPFNGDAMIRTDGTDKFYILADRKKIHVISSDGHKVAYDLSNECDTFVVVQDQCVVVNRRDRTLATVKL